jgi:hypothetical protein
MSVHRHHNDGRNSRNGHGCKNQPPPPPVRIDVATQYYQRPPNSIFLPKSPNGGLDMNQPSGLVSVIPPHVYAQRVSEMNRLIQSRVANLWTYCLIGMGIMATAAIPFLAFKSLPATFVVLAVGGGLTLIVPLIAWMSHQAKVAIQIQDLLQVFNNEDRGRAYWRIVHTKKILSVTVDNQNEWNQSVARSDRFEDEQYEVLVLGDVEKGGVQAIYPPTYA